VEHELGALVSEPRTFAQDRLDNVAERCYRERATQLYGYGRRLGLDRAAAEEVVQEAFVRLLREHVVPPEPEAWLFRVLHNLTMDRYRQAARRLRAVPVETAIAEADVEAAAVWEEVDRLPERQRASVYLRYRADLDFATIARVLDISESGARANVFRALERLREWMVER
jgi:RNA polymerase sigma-70 factor (ECF subfamily)